MPRLFEEQLRPSHGKDRRDQPQPAIPQHRLIGVQLGHGPGFGRPVADRTGDEHGLAGHAAVNGYLSQPIDLGFGIWALKELALYAGENDHGIRTKAMA